MKGIPLQDRNRPSSKSKTLGDRTYFLLRQALIFRECPAKLFYLKSITLSQTNSSIQINLLSPSTLSKSHGQPLSASCRDILAKYNFKRRVWPSYLRPVNVLIKIRNWQWIGHTLRKGDNSFSG